MRVVDGLRRVQTRDGFDSVGAVMGAHAPSPYMQPAVPPAALGYAAGAKGKAKAVRVLPFDAPCYAPPYNPHAQSGYATEWRMPEPRAPSSASIAALPCAHSAAPMPQRPASPISQIISPSPSCPQLLPPYQPPNELRAQPRCVPAAGASMPPYLSTQMMCPQHEPPREPTPCYDFVAPTVPGAHGHGYPAY